MCVCGGGGGGEGAGGCRVGVQGEGCRVRGAGDLEWVFSKRLRT